MNNDGQRYHHLQFLYEMVNSKLLIYSCSAVSSRWSMEQKDTSAHTANDTTGSMAIPMPTHNEPTTLSIFGTEPVKTTCGNCFKQVEDTCNPCPRGQTDYERYTCKGATYFLPNTKLSLPNMSLSQVTSQVDSSLSPTGWLCCLFCIGIWACCFDGAKKFSHSCPACRSLDYQWC